MKTIARAFVCIGVAAVLGVGVGCSGADSSSQNVPSSVNPAVPSDQTVSATLPASPAAMKLGVNAWVTTARITRADGLHTVDVTTTGTSATGEPVARMQGRLEQLRDQAPMPYAVQWTNGVSSAALTDVEQGSFTVALRESYRAILDDHAQLPNSGLQIQSPGYPNCCKDEASIATHLLEMLLAATGVALLACATPIIDTVACIPAIVAEVGAGLAYQDAMSVLWTCVGEKAKECGGPIAVDAGVATPVVAD